jgi:hypothetical protein
MRLYMRTCRVCLSGLDAGRPSGTVVLMVGGEILPNVMWKGPVPCESHDFLFLGVVWRSYRVHTEKR